MSLAYHLSCPSDKVLMFMSDGRPDESKASIIDFIRNITNLEVKLLTYGLGEGNIILFINKRLFRR